MQILMYTAIVVGAFVAYYAKKLTMAAAFLGAAIAALVYACAGLVGIAMMAAFFIMGVGATAWRKQWKADNKLTENHTGKRDAGQVIANAGMAAIVCVVAFFNSEIEGIAPLLTAAVFSAATADTLASELGNILGSRYFHILTFKKANRGVNGVISLEGTLAGIAGSGTISIIYGAFYHDFNYTGHIIAAGTVGNIMDSLLGIAENKGLLTNNAVNFLNTISAVATMLLLIQLF